MTQSSFDLDRSIFPELAKFWVLLNFPCLPEDLFLLLELNLTIIFLTCLLLMMTGPDDIKTNTIQSI